MKNPVFTDLFKVVNLTYKSESTASNGSESRTEPTSEVSENASSDRGSTTSCSSDPNAVSESNTNLDFDETSSPITLQNAISVTRHDHHNIEIKATLEVHDKFVRSELDVYLFVPRSFEILSLGKDELQKDFRSRARLAIPLGKGKAQTALETLRTHLKNQIEVFFEAFEKGELVSAPDHPLHRELLESTKDLCAVVSETLKKNSIEQAKLIFYAHSLLTTSDASINALNETMISARSTGELIEDVRQMLAPRGRNNVPIFSLLNEFISQLYIQYLGNVRQELEKHQSPPPAIDEAGYSTARKGLESELDRLQANEASTRIKFGLAQVMNKNEIERERHLIRMTHLKKFFQSKTFIDITKQVPAKKFSESTAAAGTAVAGIVAATLQQFHQPDMVNFASQGLFVIGFGVIIYVLRDRVKDWTIARFAETTSRFTSDIEQHLWAKDRRIGTVREWFRLTEKKKIDQEVQEKRHQASHSEMELELLEDIFHYRKVEDLNCFPTGTNGHGSPIQNIEHRALHENLRINLERHLKLMDDPFKELTELDLFGKLKSSTSHRVYHFYLVVRARLRTSEVALYPRPWWRRGASIPSNLQEEHTTTYRVVLDKNGVVRIEEPA